MDPQTHRFVCLMLDMVVIGRDRFGPIQAPHASSGHNLIHKTRNLSAIFSRKPTCQTHVEEIRTTGILP
jgi:hypothetical protein